MTRSPPLGAVLLDMDGTLVDTEPLWFEVTRTVLRGLGHELPADAAQELLGLDAAAVLALLRTRYGVEVDRAQLAERFRAELEPALAQARARPGAEALVSRLAAAGTARAIVSNSSHEVIEATLAPHAWAPTLTRRFSVDDVARGKPDPDVYLHAARELGVDQSACVAVEDSVTGAAAAVAAGMRCIAVAFDPLERAPLERVTPHVVSSLADALALLDLPPPRRARHEPA